MLSKKVRQVVHSIVLNGHLNGSCQAVMVPIGHYYIMMAPNRGQKVDWLSGGEIATLYYCERVISKYQYYEHQRVI